MSGPARPKVRPWTWHHQATHIPGAKVVTNKSQIYIPPWDLRRIADEIHDIADQLEYPEGGNTE